MPTRRHGPFEIEWSEDELRRLEEVLANPSPLRSRKWGGSQRRRRFSEVGTLVEATGASTRSLKTWRDTLSGGGLRGVEKSLAAKEAAESMKRKYQLYRFADITRALPDSVV